MAALRAPRRAVFAFFRHDLEEMASRLGWDESSCWTRRSFAKLPAVYAADEAASSSASARIYRRADTVRRGLPGAAALTGQEGFIAVAAYDGELIRRGKEFF